MISNETFTEFRFFVLTDYEIEEDYLRRMHRDGWKLTRVNLPGFYHFEKCEPEDVIYRIDFRPQEKSEKETYTQLFEDYGWEYLQDMSDFSYFRKPAADVRNENDAEIFNDNASRLAMLKRIFRCRMIPVIVIFFACFIPNFCNSLYKLANIGFSWTTYLCGGLLFFLCLLLGIILGRCVLGFRRLSKKYSSED